MPMEMLVVVVCLLGKGGPALDCTVGNTEIITAAQCAEQKAKVLERGSQPDFKDTFVAAQCVKVGKGV